MNARRMPVKGSGVFDTKTISGLVLPQVCGPSWDRTIRSGIRYLASLVGAEPMEFRYSNKMQSRIGIVQRLRIGSFNLCLVYVLGW
jgi:hypothetical protein